jgi:hypothetical protein
MSKSESICRAAFHHSEAVRGERSFWNGPSHLGSVPSRRCFIRIRSCSCDSCPRMSLVSAMIRGEQAYEPSHQIRDHLQTILKVHLPCFDEELPLACVSLSITWVGRPAQPSEQLGACWAVATFGLVLLRRLVFRRRDLRVLDRAPSDRARQP